MPIMKWLDEHLEEFVLTSSLIILSSLTIINVILRYVFNQSIIWGEEVCKLSLITSGFFSIGYSIKHKIMIRIDFFIQMANRKTQVFLEYVIALFLLFFFGAAFYAGILVVQENLISGQESASLRIPVFLIYLVPVAGFLLAVVRIVQQILRPTRTRNNATVRE